MPQSLTRHVLAVLSFLGRGGPIDYKGDNVIWVVDTGIDSNHEDLNVDKTRGWSYKMTNNTSDGREEYDTEDDNVGHGTNVAGVAAAKNNKKGVVGIAAGATVVPVKAMDMVSGYIDIYVVIQAVWHVADNGSPGDVVVMSFSIVPQVPVDCPLSISSILENMDTALQNVACVVRLAQYEFERVLEELATKGIKVNSSKSSKRKCLICVQSHATNDFISDFHLCRELWTLK